MSKHTLLSFGQAKRPWCDFILMVRVMPFLLHFISIMGVSSESSTVKVVLPDIVVHD